MNEFFSENDRVNRRKAKQAIESWKSGDRGKEAIACLERFLLDRKTILPGWSATYLRALGEVRTVIDVGVLHGTPSLYKAFPEAYLILVEALPEYRQACEAWLKDRPGELHNVAVGSSDGEIEINHLLDVPARSSILKHIVGGSDNSQKIRVPMKRLDSLLGGKDMQTDILLKIDTEGYELEIVKGAPELLKRVKYVITETSIRRRHEDSYVLSDLVALMKSNGFEVYDIMTTTREKPNRPGASIADTVFLNTALS